MTHLCTRNSRTETSSSSPVGTHLIAFLNSLLGVLAGLERMSCNPVCIDSIFFASSMSIPATLHNNSQDVVGLHYKFSSYCLKVVYPYPFAVCRPAKHFLLTFTTCSFHIRPSSSTTPKHFTFSHLTSS